MCADKNTITHEAQKFAAKGLFDKAIAEWKKLIKEAPNDANIFNTIGDLCLKKNSKAEAVDAYKHAADILAEDGFTSKAIALYRKVLNIDPEMMEAHLALGDLNAEKGLTGNALQSYKIVADHYTRRQETVKALGVYQKMADLNPSNIAGRISLAGMYAKEGMKPEAAKVYLEIADMHVSKAEFQEARQLFEKILALDPNNKEVYHKAGIVYLKEGKFVEACRALKPAFESDPSNQELADTYLEALSKAGKGAETEDVLKKLLANAPDNLALREKVYHLYLSNKEYEKALIEVSALADAKIESGSPEAAEELLKTFATENPQFAPGRRRLAEFYAALNRTDDAAQELLQTADILIEAGDRDRARAVLDRALELVPTMTEVQQRLVRLEVPAVAPAPPEPEITAPEPEQAAVPQPIMPEPEISAPEETTAVAPAPPEPEIAAPEPEQAAVPQPVTPEAEVSFEAPSAPPAEAPPVEVEKEDPAINAAFIEADVLIKYGLAEKALEQIEMLAGKFPESPRIRIKLQDLFRELGNTEQAVQHTLLAADLYARHGANDQADAILRAAEEMAPDHPAILSRLGKEPLAPAMAPPSPEAPVAPEEPVFEVPEAGGPSRESIELAEVQPSEIISDHVETGDMVTEMAPPAAEEAPLAPELAPTADISSEGLDACAPLLDEALPASEMPVSEQQPAIAEAPITEFEQPEHEFPATSFEAEQAPKPQAPEVPAVSFEAEQAPEPPAPEFPAAPFEAEQAPEPPAPEFPAVPFEAEQAPEPPAPEFPAVPFEAEQAPEPPAPEFPAVPLEAEQALEPPATEFPAVPFEAEQAPEPPATEFPAVPFEAEQAALEPPAPEIPETPFEATQATEALPEEPLEAAQEAPAHVLPSEVDVSEIRAEAEFYFQQGLFDEARKHYTKIIEITPDDSTVIDRLTEISTQEKEIQEFTKLAEAVDELESALASGKAEGEMAMTSSDEEAVRSLMQEIRQVKQKEKPAPQPAGDIVPSTPRKTAKPKKPKPPKIAEAAPLRPPIPSKLSNKAAEEDFFDLGEALRAESAAGAPGTPKQAEDFFDLAAELRDELSSVTIPMQPATPGEEQSLNDIFEEFKKGVEQQTAKEDADTHYNLGVAYKEMGLLDDAISEFILTPGDEPQVVQSRHMLGLCYMEKGEYNNAIIEIQNALDYAESLETDIQARMGMLYDLGLAYQGAGNSDRALNEFKTVYNADAGYRDVAAKVKELQEGDFISFDQLKDDIEKEISSKFFEEGERIEREEKTRKNEKVKS